MGKRMVLACISCFLVLFHYQSAFALVMDASFGKDGLVKTRVGAHEDRAQAVAVQPDGKILVAGSSSNNANLDFALLRYNADGTLDTSFNGSGQVVTIIGSGDDAALGMALQKDGKIVVCGYSANGTSTDIALARYTGSGELDPEFGTNGTLTYPLGAQQASATAVVVQEDGAILVSGTLAEAATTKGVLLRFLADGALDTSFAGRGVAHVELAGNSRIHAMAIQRDKGIVLAGSREVAGRSKVLLVRRLADGSVDGRFGVDGVAEVLQDTREAGGHGLWVQEDGSLLVAGAVGAEARQDVALFRFTAEGKLDRGFGSGGLLSHDFNGEDDVAYAVTANTTTAFVTGYATREGQRNLILLQCPLTADTQAAFSVVTTQAQQFDGVARALALQADDKLVVAGFAEESSSSSFVVAQYTGKELAEEKSGTDAGASSFITTTSISEITRVGCLTGGVIADGSGFTFSSRGVVFSIAPYPVLFEDVVTTDTTTDTTSTTSDTTNSTDSTNTTTTTAIAKRATATTVTEGYTSNGSGAGVFSSILNELSPGTRYYVRAYGVTSKNIVYYGNQLEFKTKDSCFIATAAYGSLLDPHVQVLRQFRDTYLLVHEPGRMFVRFYYHYSPPVAAYIADRPVLRLLARVLLAPVVAGSSLVVHFGVTLTGFVLLAVAGCAMLALRMRRRCCGVGPS